MACSLPDALPVTLPGLREMVKACSSILGAHTHVYCQQKWLGGDGNIACNLCEIVFKASGFVGRAFSPMGLSPRFWSGGPKSLGILAQGTIYSKIVR